MVRTFFLAPSAAGVGLTSICLGIVRALDREGLRVAFFAPIEQPRFFAEEPERATGRIEDLTGAVRPTPIPLRRAEAMLSAGEVDELMEEIVGVHQRCATDVDVVIVEGLIPSRTSPYTERLNAALAKALDAETILVTSAEGCTSEELEERIGILARLYGSGRAAGQAPGLVGCILNRVDPASAVVEAIRARRGLFNDGFRLLGAIPLQPDLAAARTLDVSRFLRATVLHEGELERRRVMRVAVCARTVPNMVDALTAGTLVVTPPDRGDIIVATALSVLNGVSIAGLLLAGDTPPEPAIMRLCAGALTAGLPVLSVAADTYETATRLSTMPGTVPLDDGERVERVMTAMAERIDATWLKSQCAEPREPRMSPAAFRYRITQRARDANRRIVLPEGDEPRTIHAAAICQERGIARCVLLGGAEAVRAVADAHGVALPAGVEILDPEGIRDRFVEPLVALRQHKGVTPQMAAQMLEDTVVLGTMMLACDEVDGLVSGAVHTTANTIQPALQLIRTAPGVQRVSSVFFMCLPGEVVVYGDCAVNTNPSADELADIAIQSAGSAAAFGVSPRVAMISYSTGVSGSGADVDKVREATRIAQERRPDLIIDGPLQYDAAAVESVGRSKAPGSPVAGRATVFVFPDLNTGNTTYKAVQRSAGAVSIGPMLQGLRKPVNDLSRGALVDDIVYTIAITAIQAQQVEDRA